MGLRKVCSMVVDLVVTSDDCLAEKMVGGLVEKTVGDWVELTDL